MAFNMNVLLIIPAYILIALPTASGNSKGRAFMVSFIKSLGRDSQNGVIITTEKKTRVYVYVPPTASLTKHFLQANFSIYLKLPYQTTVTTWGIPERKAVSVFSSEPVSMYGITTKNRSASAYLAIPLDNWSDHYIVATYDGYIKGGGEIIIISAEDNTSISVWLNVVKFTRCVARQRTVDSSTLLSFSMNREDVLRIACDDDLTGSVIKGSKPIGVISGNSCAQVPTNVPLCDQLAEMMIPPSSLGRDYIVSALGGKDTIFRVIYTDDKGTTNLTIEPTDADLRVNKANRLYKEYTISSGSVVRLHTTRPVLVVLYSMGTKDILAYGGPSMATLVPIGRYDSDYNVACSWKESIEMTRFIFDMDVYSPGYMSNPFWPRIGVITSVSAFGFTATHANISSRSLLSKESFIPDSNIILSGSALDATVAFPVGMKLDFFTGVDNCSNSPCLNGGICYTHGNKMSCYCGDELAGDRCQNRIVNACDSFPCQNNATCIDFSYTFQCVCRNSFTGDHCETELKATTTSKPKTAVVRETEMCKCTCENVTSEEIQDKKEQIKKELTVDAKETNKNKIRHTSAYDTRPSSTGIGIVGLLFLVLVFACFMALDLITAATYITTFIRNRRESNTSEKYMDKSTKNATLVPQINDYDFSTTSSVSHFRNMATVTHRSTTDNMNFVGDKSELIIAPLKWLNNPLHNSRTTRKSSHHNERATRTAVSDAATHHNERATRTGVSEAATHHNERATRMGISEDATKDIRSHVPTSEDSNLDPLYENFGSESSTSSHSVISFPRFQTDSNKILVIGEDGKKFRMRKCSWSFRQLVVTESCHSLDET